MLAFRFLTSRKRDDAIALSASAVDQGRTLEINPMKGVFKLWVDHLPGASRTGNIRTVEIPDFKTTSFALNDPTNSIIIAAI